MSTNPQRHKQDCLLQMRRGRPIRVKRTGAKVSYAPMRTTDRTPWVDADGYRYPTNDVSWDVGSDAKRDR